MKKSMIVTAALFVVGSVTATQAQQKMTDQLFKNSGKLNLQKLAPKKTNPLLNQKRQVPVRTKKETPPPIPQNLLAQVKKVSPTERKAFLENLKKTMPPQVKQEFIKLSPTEQQAWLNVGIANTLKQQLAAQQNKQGMQKVQGPGPQA